jgi:N-acetyl-D-muramate 6-phosphate phosphatase
MKPTQNSAQALLFDLDGTLLDSAPDLGAAANRLLLSLGQPERPLSDYRAWTGSGARGMLRVALDMGPDDARYEGAKADFLRFYQECLFDSTQPFEGVAPLLASLSEAGCLWGIVTNKAEWLALPLIDSIPCLAGASAVVCGDTTPHAKPHPEPLLEAARRLGVPPSACTYVGDDERDIVAGRAAGMRTVAALYGYLGPQAQPSAWGADGSVTHPGAVLSFLTSD